MNVFVRDMDLHDFNRLDGRRLEVVVDGLPLRNGARLAIDTTMVQSLLEGPASGGVDGPTPSMNAVLGDARLG